MKTLRVLRDTGASQTLARRSDVPENMRYRTGKIKTVIGIGGKPMKTDIWKIKLKSKWKAGEVEVGLLDSLPMKGISLLLGNDIDRKQIDIEPRKISTHQVERRHYN